MCTCYKCCHTIQFLFLQYTLAFKGYRRLNDVDGCIRVKEQAGDYGSAVQYRMSLNLRAGLFLAAKYAKQGIYIPNQRIEEKALFFAKRYAQKKDQGKLLSIIDCVSNVSQRVVLLKQANLFVEASELLVLNKQYRLAFRILSAQGANMKGIELAEMLKDSEMITKFVFQSAVAQLCKSGNVTDSQVLEKLNRLSTQTDPQIKAKASLLLGKALMEGDPGKAAKLFYEAYSIYKSSYPNQVGEIESFNLFSKVRSFQQVVSPIQFVAACVETSRTAVEVAKSLRKDKKPAFAIHTVHRAEEFYALQKAQDVYFLAQDQDLWVGKLKSCIEATDEDGMKKLDAQRTLQVVAKHLEDYIPMWMDHDMIETVKSKLQSFPFHKQLPEQENLTHSYKSHSPVQLQEYLNVCFLALDLESVRKSNTFPEIHKVILKLLSLNTLYLPLDGKVHFSILRKSDVASNVLNDEVRRTMNKDLEDVEVDEWLECWRINSILRDRAGFNLHLLLGQRTNDANIYWKFGKIMHRSSNGAMLSIQRYQHRSRYPLPYAFIFNPRMKKYQHFFFFWMESCKCIRQGNVITAVRLSLNKFFCVIARRRSLQSVSVMNIVNVFSVYTTAIFAILSYSGFPHTQRYTFFVPHTFKHIVESFDGLNCQKKGQHCLLFACAQNARKGKPFQKLEEKAFKLLWEMLDILVGRYRECYHVLRNALSLPICSANSEALHCLVLTLTMLGNLALVGYEEPYINEFRKNICDALKHIKRANEHTELLFEVCEELTYCTDARDILRSMVLKLLASIDKSAGLCGFRIDHHKQRQQLATVSFVDIPSHCIPRRKLTPLQHPQEQLLSVSVQRTATDTQQSHAGPLTKEGGGKQSHKKDLIEQPQVAPVFNKSTEYPEANESEEPETHKDDATDDDDTDDDDINNVLDNVGKDTEAVTDEKQHKEDESLVDENFCCACGEKTTSETYETHCLSEHHKQNVDLYEAFVIAEKQYRQGVTKLEHFLQECQDIEKLTPSLDNLISLITSALRDHEQQINETKRKYNWSKEISEMGNEMNTLLKQGQMELQEARDTVSDKDDKGEDSDTDLDDPDEPLPISKADQKQGKEKKRKESPKKRRKRKN